MKSCSAEEPSVNCHPISRGDRWGVLLSALCGVHCMILPVASSLMPLVFNQHSNLFHLLMIVLIVPVGFWAFLSGYRRHGRLFFASLALLGVSCLILDLVLHFLLHSQPESGLLLELSFLKEVAQYSLLPLLGSTLLVTAHWLNWKAPCRPSSI